MSKFQNRVYLPICLSARNNSHTLSPTLENYVGQVAIILYAEYNFDICLY